MQKIQVFADIQQVYSEFVANKKDPELQSRNNGDRSRFFLNQYFSLDLGSAPDFMDQDKYMNWLQSELLH
ncbi:MULTISPECIES: hypothetical protein [unclassified Acinetobacter]|uniref:hypothetical protein n=1 Tax=unclassified Acinetobacter TaxID=196816 RepID=UPI001C24B4DF|nr:MULTISPECIES: hypothetical protein [unclassified Acinetobacter]